MAIVVAKQEQPVVGVAVSGTLRYGEDREPRRRRWRLAVAVLGIVLALGATSVWYLPALRQDGARADPSAGGASAAVGAGPRAPAVAPSPSPSNPATLIGSLPGHPSPSLLLAGQEPAWLSLATGRAEPIRGLPGGSGSYQFLRVAGGWAAQPFPVVHPSCDDCAAVALPVYYVADGSLVAHRIGTAGFAAPAATPGALWLVSYPPGANLTTASGDAREVSVTGAALGQGPAHQLRLPAGYAIDQGTGAGLLLAQEMADPESASARYELWDPGTGRVTRSFANVIAASPTQIAWLPPCTTRCRVQVLDLADGQVKGISLPAPSQAFKGAFSPDGRLLAFLLATQVTRDGHPVAGRLVVTAVANGRITAVPGTTFADGNGVTFGWQPGSHQLIADVALNIPGQPQWRISAWQPGAAKPSTAVVRMQYQSWPILDRGPY